MIRGSAVFPIVALVYALADGLAARQEPAPRFATNTALVRLEVSVFKANGPVKGLRDSDFEVSDAGVPIKGFSVQALVDRPIDIALVTQSFRSLHGEQVMRFRETVSSLVSAPSAEDRLAITVASAPPMSPRLLLPGKWHGDPAVLNGSDEAALWDAVGIALLSFPPSDRANAVIVVADGIDRRSVVTPAMVARLAARLRAQIVFIGSAGTLIRGFKVRSVPGGSPSSPKLETMALIGNAFPSPELRSLARDTGGQVIDIIDRAPARLVGDLLMQLRSGYVISYPGIGPKGWHAVTVRVRDRSAMVATRAGYFVD